MVGYSAAIESSSSLGVDSGSYPVAESVGESVSVHVSVLVSAGVTVLLLVAVVGTVTVREPASAVLVPELPVTRLLGRLEASELEL